MQIPPQNDYYKQYKINVLQPLNTFGIEWQSPLSITAVSKIHHLNLFFTQEETRTESSLGLGCERSLSATICVHSYQ